MLVKTLEIKNISDKIINLSNYTIAPIETLKIHLDEIDNSMWRNIIALVNSRELDYKMIDEEVKVLDKEETIISDKQEETQEEVPKKRTRRRKKKEN